MKKYLEPQFYPPQPYHRFPPNVTDSVPNGTTIYHVTKEFGDASMGELGQIVTSLAKAQAKADSKFNVNVIIPRYSFLTDLYQIQSFTQLSIQVRDETNNWKEVIFTVGRFFWKFTDNLNVLSKNPSITRKIGVYLIGPAKNFKPLNLAYKKVQNNLEIYSSSSKLPQEWKDLYFCKAVAELITFLNSNPESSLFDRFDPRGVDIVHLHGVTNALVLDFIKQFYREESNKVKRKRKSNKLANYKEILLSYPPPSIVYTLHDYQEEQFYSNKVINVNKFLDLTNREDLTKYIYGSRFYPSALAIDYSEVVTIVSASMAREMVEESLEFEAKELIIPSILNRSTTGHWIGITNGVDFNSFNPFNDSKLLEFNSSFPRNIDNFDNELLYAELIEESSQELVINAKSNARKHLIKEKILDSKDFNRILLLYVGKFQYNQGLEFFSHVAEIISKYDAKFIIMGQPNDYPIKYLYQIQSKYPENILIISNLELQSKWGTLFRVATDLKFVPSLTKSFRLIAAEGLLFGSSIISTDIGDLSEFLINKSSKYMIEGYNSYLFKLVNDKDNNKNNERYQLVQRSIEGLKIVLTMALEDYIRLKNNLQEKEIFIRNLIKDALKLSWNRKDGPLNQYTKAYSLAMSIEQKNLKVNVLY
ncbi:1399_t:CDS:1 [Diversispora eburnea]|uniref:1399_t:CDS:1 n=1 Tax=Diversispora eburnea TaxID=1213867 RepID=A0A9N8WQ46_9GLOM|nr:1399_t:CDS:1 [Diversispora eburnea]